MNYIIKKRNYHPAKDCKLSSKNRFLSLPGIDEIILKLELVASLFLAEYYF